MVSNDQVILRKVLQEKKSQLAPDMADHLYFDLFCAEQILKDYDLDYDEIESGIVEGGLDGGIDAIYAFVNGDRILDDTDSAAYTRDIALELVVIQSKRATNFQEAPIDRLLAATRDLLDLNRSLADLSGIYNPAILSAMTNFRRLVEELATKFPRLEFRYYYCTQGIAADVHPNVARKGDLVCHELKRLFSASVAEFQFFGARDLLDLARREPVRSLTLPLVDNPISTSDNGYVCLVSLRDYYGFITDERGTLRRGMLEANVRDYQGSVEVNKGIARSLELRGAEDFWWLNNGATVIASRGSMTGKTLTLEDPKIVNGLQSSMEIFKFFAAHTDALADEKRSVLVKVIITDEEACRDLVISATNSQTSIPAASMRATDKIHRDIEDFFEAHGLHYDRRKNYHKNRGRPIDRIITIPLLAQSVMAIVLREPDNARARPSSLLKNTHDYRRVFTGDYPITAYLSCARIMRRVDAFLRKADGQVRQDDKTNLRYHLAMWAGCWLAQKGNPTPQEIAGLLPDSLTDAVLRQLFDSLQLELTNAVLNDEYAMDRARAAKSREFRDRILALTQTVLSVSGEPSSDSETT